MKKGWRELISTKFEFDRDDYTLVLGEESPSDAIQEIEKALGLSFPKELISLYREVNGFGLADDEGIVSWAIPRLEEMASFVARIRDWIGTAHPEVASRFLPVFDWGDGSAIGFLQSPRGRWFGSLYQFEHDLMSGDPEQDLHSFMTLSSRSVRHFIQGR
ncbi:MAG: SMI1/KNR4 family protein [Akkermansiaceae bacterium]|jgi:hypothetical protein